MKSFRLLFAVIPLFVLFSCNQHTLYDHYEPVHVEGWNYKEPVRFTYQVTDTNEYTDVYLKLRHTEDYPWMNIFFFMTTIFPDSTYAKDTIECFLADQSGEWFGQGYGHIKSDKFLLKQKVRFPMLGTYVFELTHGMREPELKEIKDVGLMINRQESTTSKP